MFVRVCACVCVHACRGLKPKTFVYVCDGAVIGPESVYKCVVFVSEHVSFEDGKAEFILMLVLLERIHLSGTTRLTSKRTFSSLRLT